MYIFVFILDDERNIAACIRQYQPSIKVHLVADLVQEEICPRSITSLC